MLAEVSIGPVASFLLGDFLYDQSAEMQEIMCAYIKMNIVHMEENSRTKSMRQQGVFERALDFSSNPSTVRVLSRQQRDMANEACVTTKYTYKERKEDDSHCPPHLDPRGRCCVLHENESNHRFLGALAFLTPKLDEDVRLGGGILKRLPSWAAYKTEASELSGGNRLFVHEQESWYNIFIKFCFLAKSQPYVSYYVFATTDLQKRSFFSTNLTNWSGAGMRLVMSNHGIYLRPSDTELLDFAEGVVTTKTINIIHQSSVPLKIRRAFHGTVCYMSATLEDSFTSNVEGSVDVTQLPRILGSLHRDSYIDFASVALYIESDKSWEDFFVDVFVAFALKSILHDSDHMINDVRIDTNAMSTAEQEGLRNLTASEINADHVRSIGDRYLSSLQMLDTDHTYEIRHRSDQKVWKWEVTRTNGSSFKTRMTFNKEELQYPLRLQSWK